MPRKKKRKGSSSHLIGMSLLALGVGFLISYDAALQMDGIHIRGGKMHEEEDTTAGTDNIPATTLELLGKIVIKQKEMYTSILEPEYGRFSSIFRVENLQKIFQLTPLSRKRLIRKLMIKILMARIKNGDGNNESVFRWATAGDSAAAGHGNSYSSSYTSILQQTVGDVFHSTAGIKFIATNHAGNAYSGMELAMCMETIFGEEVDVLSWDFAEVPIYVSERYNHPTSPSQGIDPLMFGDRAGRVFPHLPFVFFIGLFSDGEAWDSLQKLEVSGMGLDLLAGERFQEILMSFPDYVKFPDWNSLEAVRKIHCNEVIEGKEVCNVPSQLFSCVSEQGAECAKAKYDLSESCAIDNRFHTAWNDGHKLHRLKGRLLGFHLIEMLRLATLELDLLERQRPQLRNNPSFAVGVLRKEDEVDEFLFVKTRSSSILGDNPQDSNVLRDWDILKKRDTVCLNAKTTSLKASKPDNMPKFKSDPPRGTTCDDYKLFQNVYFTIPKGKPVSIDPFADSHEQYADKQADALGLCFKHCYGNTCVDQQSVSYGGLDGTPLDLLDNVEIRLGGNIISNLKEVGGCFLLQGGGVTASKMQLKVLNYGDDALMLSSAFALI